MSSKKRSIKRRAALVNKSESWVEGLDSQREKRLAKARRQFEAAAALTPETLEKDPRYRKLNQQVIDIVRLRVDVARKQQAVIDQNRILTKKYLWFPKNDCDKYELRDGNPPADVDRPKWLRGYKLWLTDGEIDTKTWDAYNHWWKKRQSSQHKPRNAQERLVADHNFWLPDS